MNSIYHQGMLNPAMNYGLIFETLLAAILCYTPGLTFALGTRPLKFLHWMPGIPYSIFIFLYDETRKKIMRSNVVMTRDSKPDKSFVTLDGSSEILTIKKSQVVVTFSLLR